MKKRTIRLLRGGLWLLLCAALTLCALSLRSEAPPREDVDAASRMLVSSSELLYDADSTSQISFCRPRNSSACPMLSARWIVRRARKFCSPKRFSIRRTPFSVSTRRGDAPVRSLFYL